MLPSWSEYNRAAHRGACPANQTALADRQDKRRSSATQHQRQVDVRGDLSCLLKL